jgi:hypothetical protein
MRNDLLQLPALMGRMMADDGGWSRIVAESGGAKIPGIKIKIKITIKRSEVRHPPIHLEKA